MRTSFISFALFAFSVPRAFSSGAHCSGADDVDEVSCPFLSSMYTAADLLQDALAYTGADQVVVAGASTLANTDGKGEELYVTSTSL